MMYQILLTDQIRNVFYYLQASGILDILIPFVLIFTVLFAILKNVKILEEPRHHITIAIAITLLVIIPHITGTIPPQYDVVQIINNSLPSIVLIIFIGLAALILLGFIKGEKVEKFGDLTQGVLAILSVVLVIIIFARSAGYMQTGLPTWLYWIDDPNLGALVVVILIFVLITWFIVSPKDSGKAAWGKFTKGVKEIGKGLLGS